MKKPLTSGSSLLHLIGRAGTWLHVMALGWLALELTGSGTALGWVAAAMFGSLLVLGSWAGALADRVDKQRLLAAVQLLSAAPAAALGLLALAGQVTAPVLFASTLVGGVVYAVENPVRHAIVGAAAARSAPSRRVGCSSRPTSAGASSPTQPASSSRWRVCS